MGIFLIALSVAFGCFYFFKDKKDRGDVPEAAIAFAIVMFFMTTSQEKKLLNRELPHYLTVFKVFLGLDKILGEN